MADGLYKEDTRILTSPAARTGTHTYRCAAGPVLERTISLCGSVIDSGGVEEIDAAFRGGMGDYVHQQGPAPQQIERESIGYIVASVGEAMPPVAFSSLMASREFLKTDAAKAFVRAYARARWWVNQTPAEEVADREAEFFPQTDRDALIKTIARYQDLGCWDGDLMITRERYEQALNVFLHSSKISRRYPYESVVVHPPGEL